MKTITLNTYSFSELSERARERAKDDHRSLFGYSWADEALESLKALALHFNATLSDWSIDWDDSSYSSARFDVPETYSDEDNEAFIGNRMLTLGSFDSETLKGNGDCVLTGFCMDEDAIDGLRASWAQGERDLEKLMEAAFRSWLKACQSDAAEQYSDECFGEMCEANDYMFFESGKLAR